jgi:hypothetical protein
LKRESSTLEEQNRKQGWEIIELQEGEKDHDHQKRKKERKKEREESHSQSEKKNFGTNSDRQ